MFFLSPNQPLSLTMNVAQEKVLHRISLINGKTELCSDKTGTQRGLTHNWDMTETGHSRTEKGHSRTEKGLTSFDEFM